MTLKTQQRIVPVHAAAVITHRNKAGPSAGEIHPNSGRSGVQAVLDEFLDEGGRPLNNLARRNLARNVIRQKANFSHTWNGGAVAEPLQQKPKEFLRKGLASKSSLFEKPALPSGLGIREDGRFFDAFVMHPFDFASNHT